MKNYTKILTAVLLSALLVFACRNNAKEGAYNTNVFEFNHNIETRWNSPENRSGARGGGGKENNSAKGHAYDSIAAGSSYALLDVQECGMINRIWITINDRSPEMLRALKIEMFWDGEEKPAVSVPFGDFFCAGLGKTISFQNVFFANPEGRSFNCFIPMPLEISKSCCHK